MLCRGYPLFLTPIKDLEVVFVIYRYSNPKCITFRIPSYIKKCRTHLTSWVARPSSCCRTGKFFLHFPELQSCISIACLRSSFNIYMEQERISNPVHPKGNMLSADFVLLQGKAENQRNHDYTLPEGHVDKSEKPRNQGLSERMAQSQGITLLT